MSAMLRNRLRKLAVIVAAALAALGWAAAAAAQFEPPLDDDRGIERAIGLGSGEPDPDQMASPPPRGDAEHVAGAEETAGATGAPDAPSADQALAALPADWEDPVLLARAAIQVNALLTRADAERRLVPWATADHVRRSLFAGRELVDRIDPENRPAYFQAVYFSALAAGYPREALKAAVDLLELDRARAWNWLALYYSAMACGDGTACREAVENLRRAVPPHMLEPLQQQAEPIGSEPSFTIDLSDGTRFSTADARGKVVVFDVWIHNQKPYLEAFPLVRRLFDTFKDYADFRMIGINMDRQSNLVLARQFMRANRMDWPVHFEGQSGDRPISFKALKSQRIPSQAVLSPQGKVIFLGMPNDPVLYYAIRGGLVEAAGGGIPTTQPDSADPPAPTIALPAGPDPAGPGSAPAGVADPAAQRAAREKAAAEQVRLAEAFEAADFKPRAVEIYRAVLRDYPDTEAAIQAQARLLVLHR